jgi:uncharacterized membrane protein (UPF0127 family)
LRPAFAFAAILALALAVACGGRGGSLRTVTVAVVGGDGARAELTVELARSAEERARGLSLRDELPQDRGMLFVFGEDTEAAFWMKDTSIPLSIAFIAADGTILDIQEMEPFSTQLHSPPAPYRYALEVNRGWFQEDGFAEGDRVEIPAAVAEEE